MTEQFDAVACARSVLAGCRRGALATLGDDDMPFASLVAVSVGPGRQPLLLLSELAVHTHNLAQRPKASLLLVENGHEAQDPLVLTRLTLSGRVGRCSDQDKASEVYLGDHPQAAGYAGFGDFAFYELTCRSAHLVAGFGRIETLSPDQLFLK
jgi:putative heme iron utilization protein